MNVIARTRQKIKDLDVLPVEGMTSPTAEKHINELVELLNVHAHRYYVLDNPLISDSEYDQLYRSLQNLESHYPELVRNNSPTRRVGSKPLDKFERVQHSLPMLSLGNAFNGEELRAWYKRCIKGLQDVYGEEVLPSLTVELKIDGLALSLVYEKGAMVLGATRGNGIEGENITSQAKTVSSIPLSVPVVNEGNVSPPDVLEVRGEVYMAKTDFENLNQYLAAQQKKNVRKS